MRPLYCPPTLRRLSDSRRVVENTELEPSRRHATTAAGAGPSRQPAAGGPGVTPTADAALPSLWETRPRRDAVRCPAALCPAALCPAALCPAVLCCALALYRTRSLRHHTRRSEARGQTPV
ncbi:unnamed protein product [Gadus morhua 'NCC']